MSTLNDRMVGLNARLGGLYSRFGVPQYVNAEAAPTEAYPVPPNVVLEDLQTGTQVVIQPNPKVRQVSPKAVGTWLSESVQISGDEQVIEGIPRSYPVATVSEYRYLLNPTWDGSKWVSRFATCVYLDRTELLTWKVTVAPRRAK